MKHARLILRIVGGFSVVLAFAGLGYIAAYLRVDYSTRPQPPCFFQAWHIMASIDAVLLICGVLLGIALLRCKVAFVTAFVVLQALVVAYSFAPGLFWLNPRYGSSIAAASGISAGTIVPVFVLFPVWGSIAAIAAARRIRKGPGAPEHA